MHETYAVAVTPNGDLLQWGLGYSRKPSQPSPTLKGQDIVQVALTPSKIYARTKGGKVLILPVSQADQTDTSAGKVLPTVSWFWKAFGYRDPGVHFVTMSAANPDRVKMKISHISAGRSHLLAMAEDGRACCAAVDGNANEMGQLGGGQKLLDAISSKAGNGGDPIVLEKAIEFDTTLKEIPALRNLKVDQLVSGDRHSLALTTEGRVLGWGNNSLGCDRTDLKRADGMVSDAIYFISWQATGFRDILCLPSYSRPDRMRSHCLLLQVVPDTMSIDLRRRGHVLLPRHSRRPPHP